MARKMRSQTMTVAIAFLGIAVTAVSGCSPPPQTLQQRLNEEGATPDSLTPGMVKPDGTLNNGLLPEQWGDTS